MTFDDGLKHSADFSNWIEVILRGTLVFIFLSVLKFSNYNILLYFFFFRCINIIFSINISEFFYIENKSLIFQV